jgi:hypothetical protein
MSFWTSDNAVIESLLLINEPHYLVTSSLVYHLDNGSKTLLGLNEFERYKLTTKEVKKFNKIFNKNLFGIGKD